MPIWTIEPVSELPQVTLDAWSVFEVPLSGLNEAWTRHLVGFSRQGQHGQVSSPVVRFDPATRAGVSRSGRVYQLAGHPGSDADARYVWARWKSMWNIPEERDVSDDVYADILRATQRVAK